MKIPMRDRRTLLRGLATLPLIGSVGAVAAAVTPDPVFAAIAKRVSAFEAFSAALKIADGENVDQAAEAESDAMYELAGTDPKTLAGLRAMVEHFDRHLGLGDAYGAEMAFPSIAAACRRLLPIGGAA